jgi:hypothetical protein
MFKYTEEHRKPTKYREIHEHTIIQIHRGTQEMYHVQGNTRIHTCSNTQRNTGNLPSTGKCTNTRIHHYTEEDRKFTMHREMHEHTNKYLHRGRQEIYHVQGKTRIHICSNTQRNTGNLSCTGKHTNTHMFKYTEEHRKPTKYREIHEHTIIQIHRGTQEIYHVQGNTRIHTCSNAQRNTGNLPSIGKFTNTQ